MNKLMVTVASRLSGKDVSNIASHFLPNEGLSDQAVDVLKQFVESDAVEMIKIQAISLEGTDNIYAAGSIDISYSEPKFIETDVDSLVDAGLITKTSGRSGGFIYKIIRQAVRFIDAIDNK